MEERRSFTLYSGGASGSDNYWETFGSLYGLTVKSFSFDGHHTTNPHAVVLSDDELKKADYFLERANQTLLRRFPTRNKFCNDLLRRNWHVVKDVDTVFALGEMVSNKTVNGGTGWAVQLAVDEKKKVYVFDDKKNGWSVYDHARKRFVPFHDVPTLSKNFAGVGTRNLTDEGKIEIEGVFGKTFGKNVNKC